MHTCRPYFVRFTQTPAGANLARIQAKRMARVDLLPVGDHEKVVAELCQFLSTLFIIYALDFDEVEDRELLLARVKEWRDMYKGTFADETAKRVIDMLFRFLRPNLVIEVPCRSMNDRSLEKTIFVCEAR